MDKEDKIYFFSSILTLLIPLIFLLEFIILSRDSSSIIYNTSLFDYLMKPYNFYILIFIITFMLLLFLFFKESYRNKLTFFTSIVVMITSSIYFLGYFLHFWARLLGINFFMEGNPGFFISMFFGFVVAPIIIVLIYIILFLLILGIIKGFGQRFIR